MSLSEYYMKRCLELAKKGIPSTRPNPSVGAVLVHDGVIIGEGYTSPFGGHHGEVNCINSVKQIELIQYSTLYVSLEPCSHTGKTPPCADLIVKSQIPKVVIGCLDTFSEVSGKGIERLRQNGVEVEVNILEKECRELNKRFFTFHEKQRPFITLKWAETADNFIAPTTELHETERWITGEKANQFSHSLRSTEMAILIGKNTVFADNPSLTTRNFSGGNPVRIVIDKIGKNTVFADNPSLTTRNFSGGNPVRIVIDKRLESWKSPRDFFIYQEEAPTWIVNEERNFRENTVEGIQISFEGDILAQLMTILYERNIQSLLVEGGQITLQQFIDTGMWDEAFVISSTKTFQNGVKAPRFSAMSHTVFNTGHDRVTHYKNTDF